MNDFEQKIWAAVYAASWLQFHHSGLVSTATSYANTAVNEFRTAVYSRGTDMLPVLEGNVDETDPESAA